jgi:hypothetical protein
MTTLIKLVDALEALENEAIRTVEAQCETHMHEEIPHFDAMASMTEVISELPAHTDEEFQAKARAARIARRHFANAA